MLPFPPFSLMKTVGPTEKKDYDNPSGNPVFGNQVPLINYSSVFDFGCGCGRIARQMMQQVHPPKVYVGVDLYKDSIKWCSENLSSINSRYEFYHLDVFNPSMNPYSDNKEVPFPTSDKFSLVNAHSVFTHITEPHLCHYLTECARVLDVNGVFRATWFLFDKTGFPMMQEFQNGLYINLDDPSNAAIFDYRFVERMYEKNGLVIYKIIPPAVRGFQWIIYAAHKDDVLLKAVFPEDAAPTGIVRPPI